MDSNDAHLRARDARDISQCRDNKERIRISDQPLYIPEYMVRIKGHDFEGAMRMIKEKKVYPLKEGLDVVVVEVIQGGIVRFRLRSTPVGLFTIKGTHYTTVEAIQL